MFSDCRLYKTYLSYTHLFLYIIFPTFFKQKCGGFRFPFFCEYSLAVTADAQCTFFSFKIGTLVIFVEFSFFGRGYRQIGKRAGVCDYFFKIISRFIFVSSSTYLYVWGTDKPTSAAIVEKSDMCHFQSSNRLSTSICYWEFVRFCFSLVSLLSKRVSLLI